MYEYIKGQLVESFPDAAIIDVSGLGYRISIPLSTYSKLPAKGSTILLYISHVVREDSERLYGFLSKEERSLFEKCNDISGIGPKTSLALIGHLSFHEFTMAVASANDMLLSKVPGIGKKTAQRIIMELKDKIGLMATSDKMQDTSTASLFSGTVVSDAVNALVNLGYHPLNAQKAVQNVVKDASSDIHLSELITSALRKI